MFAKSEIFRRKGWKLLKILISCRKYAYSASEVFYLKEN